MRQPKDHFTCIVCGNEGAGVRRNFDLVSLMSWSLTPESDDRGLPVRAILKYRETSCLAAGAFGALDVSG